MRVVVALIVNEREELLITQRSFQSSFGGLWEFPGGKVEPLEEDVSALIREIKEEIDLTVTGMRFLGEVIDDSRSSPVSLQIYLVDSYEGKPRCCIGQLDMQWVSFIRLNEYAFPVANQTIMRLPLVLDYFS